MENPAEVELNDVFTSEMAFIIKCLTDGLDKAGRELNIVDGCDEVLKHTVKTTESLGEAILVLALAITVLMDEGILSKTLRELQKASSKVLKQ